MKERETERKMNLEKLSERQLKDILYVCEAVSELSHKSKQSCFYSLNSYDFRSNYFKSSSGAIVFLIRKSKVVYQESNLEMES